MQNGPDGGSRSATRHQRKARFWRSTAWCSPKAGTVPAHQFMNFMLDGKNSAELTNLIGSGNPNMDAMQYIRPEIADNEAIFPDTETLSRLEMLHDLDRRQRRRLSRLWTEIKLR